MKSSRHSLANEIGASFFVLVLSSIVATAQPPSIGPSFIDTIAGISVPSGARTGDVDGDGDVDAVYLKSGQIIAMLNDGAGTFTQVASPGPTPGALFALGDLNGDGGDDVIAVEPNMLTTWFHAGSGLYLAGQSIAIPGAQGRNPCVLNLNPGADTDVDVAFIETNAGVGRIRLLANNGSGVLGDAGVAFNIGGFNGYRIEAGDMDGDGDDDLVATYQGAAMGTPARLYIHRNNGAGFFTQVSFINLSLSSYFSNLVIADVTNDDRNDVVTHSATQIVTYVNSGMGTVASAQTTGTGSMTISGLDAADIDLDGNLDVFAVQDAAPYDGYFLAGQGDGTFVSTVFPLTGTNPNPCCPNLDDVNGDGRVDVLFSARGGLVARIGVILFGGEPADFRKVMITEASWGSPDFVEITNFGLAPADLTGWTLVWRDGIDRVSNPLAITLAPGEPAVIGEPATFLNLPLPPAIQVVEAFPPVSTTSGDFAVALRNPQGDVIDEVHVSDVNGNYQAGGLGGSFRGVALRSSSQSSRSVERIWGLDSNSGRDWSEAAARSPGNENTGAGPRGTDPLPVQTVLINEIDYLPDYLELRNPNPFPVDVTGWSLWVSSQQGMDHTVLTPFASGYVMAPGEYLVIGENTSPPSEMPGSVTYFDVPENIPWISAELDCALYDAFGRLIDLVRVTGSGDEVVHNEPRAPAHWADFRGASERLLDGGDESLGRASAVDTDQGTDFQPLFIRSMGSPNLPGDFATTSFGLDSPLDLRVNAHPLGGGFSLIANAGPANAGAKFSFFLGTGHLGGEGPFLGLGLDAVQNWLALKDVFPFGALLDPDGAHTIHLPPVISLPPGLEFDLIGILQDSSGALIGQTKVVEFDT